MWTHVIIAGVDIDHLLAADIALALGLTMQDATEMSENDPACRFIYDLLDSNGEHCGTFSFDTDLHKWPTIRLYIDFNSEPEAKYYALGGEDWLKNLLEKC